ncbi:MULTISPECIES: hypothetical protein [unclassified Nostoc]|uniref:hypothetical protein n=1 Tax=unclassified Nostoc TaxID=2593658 RepID=UPI00262DCEB0|nr:hypothetical protein [Nostoc sp. S13]MDF5739819.1 hypothetical protein [Nostoc sp. S13]
MRYIDKLHPWCIVRHFPSMQHQIVARFRRRSNAEAHLQALRRLMPSATFTIMFNLEVVQLDRITF